MQLLPSPATSSWRGKRSSVRNGFSITSQRWIDRLLLRARITNLALLLLLSATIISLSLNIIWYYFPQPIPRGPNSITSTVTHSLDLQYCSHLIIVPGHAIWRGSDADSARREDSWILEPYQKGGGRISVWLKHIERASDISRGDDRSLLIFSGGQTRPDSTTTEAESYHRLAIETKMLPSRFRRATSENYALDSFQNLLFSIARFQEVTGRYPEQITVVGYEMKRARFTNLHRAAIRWPREKFTYIGIDPEDEERAVAQQGEVTNGYRPFSTDLYGCHSFLKSKRATRNLFARFHPYHISSPEVALLLEWCPEESSTDIFPGSLPWDQ